MLSDVAGMTRLDLEGSEVACWDGNLSVTGPTPVTLQIRDTLQIRLMDDPSGEQCGAMSDLGPRTYT